MVISDVARPCAIFSYLVHIIRDFRKDQLNNLNYFAVDILEKHGLTAENLRRDRADRPTDARIPRIGAGV